MKTPRKRLRSYSIAVIARQSGVSSTAILRYEEMGLIAPTLAGDDVIRLLRRIEHLRTRYEMNRAAIEFTLRLVEERDRLQEQLRARKIL